MALRREQAHAARSLGRPRRPSERRASSSPPELPAMPPDPDHMGNGADGGRDHRGELDVHDQGDSATARSTDDASIYDVPAAMWHATLRAEGQSVSYVNVTVWQFKNRATNQIAVGVQLGPNFRHISTVKGSALIGEGTATAERSGDAGDDHCRRQGRKGHGAGAANSVRQGDHAGRRGRSIGRFHLCVVSGFFIAV